MYEEIYERIPDADAYLERLDFTSSFGLRPDVETLSELVRRHATCIAYENLDIFCSESLDNGNRPVSLAVRDLYRKIIIRGRGGYCFELNGLFYALLKELRFPVTPAYCKVIEGTGPNYPAFHRATIAWFADGPYYCDVGFGGPMPAGAMKLENNALQIFADEEYVFYRRNHNWWELVRFDENGRRVPVVYVNTEPYDPVDFCTLSYYCSSVQPTDMTRFRDNLLLNIRLDDGYASLTNRAFTLRRGPDKTVETDLSDARILELARGIFGIRDLPDGIRFFE